MDENMILFRLVGVKARFDEVGQLITDPAVISDMKRYVKLSREYRQLEPIIAAYDAYQNLLSNIESAKEMLSQEKDEELREMAKEELDIYQHKLEPLEEEDEENDHQDETGREEEMVALRARTPTRLSQHIRQGVLGTLWHSFPDIGQ